MSPDEATLVATIRPFGPAKATLVATIRASRAPKPWLVATIRHLCPAEATLVATIRGDDVRGLGRSLAHVDHRDLVLIDKPSRAESRGGSAAGRPRSRP